MKARKRWILWTLSLSALLPIGASAECEVETSASFGYKQMKEEQEYTWGTHSLKHTIEKQKYLPLSLSFRSFCNDFYVGLKGSYGFPVGKAHYQRVGSSFMESFYDTTLFSGEKKDLSREASSHPLIEVEAELGYRLSLSEEAWLSPLLGVSYRHKKGGIKKEKDSDSDLSLLFPGAHQWGWHAGIRGEWSSDPISLYASAKYVQRHQNGPQSLLDNVAWESSSSHVTAHGGHAAVGFSYRVTEDLHFGLELSYSHLRSKNSAGTSRLKNPLLDGTISVKNAKLMFSELSAKLLAVPTEGEGTRRARALTINHALYYDGLTLFDYVNGSEQANEGFVPILWDATVDNAGGNAIDPCFVNLLVNDYTNDNIPQGETLNTIINSSHMERFVKVVEENNTELKKVFLGFQSELNKELAERVKQREMKRRSKEHQFGVALSLGWDF